MITDLWGHEPIPCRVDPRWEQVRGAKVSIQLTRDPVDITWYVHGAVRYQADRLGDVWAAPAETLSRGYGDCEDIALLKRAIFITNGGYEFECVFLLVWDQIARQDHALLAVTSEEFGWVILDSRTPKVLPKHKVADYTPRFAYSGAQGWVYGRRKDAGA